MSDISYEAPDYEKGKKIVIDKDFVDEKLKEMVKNTNLK